MNIRARSSWMMAALLTGPLFVLAGCGGGGGGGGGGGSSTGGSSSSSQASGFVGFDFRTNGIPSGYQPPPSEDLGAAPPKLGAPLDVVVIFRFDNHKAPPAGPFTQTTLPIYTTPAEMLPAAIPPNGAAQIAAKGTYVQVDEFTVEFQPFLPQEPLSVTASSPPASIPGFIPGSVYTVKVQTAPGLKIANLVGSGGLVKFGTTAMPGGFFSSAGDHDPPLLDPAFPVQDLHDFYPGLHSNTPAGSADATFSPKGPETIVLHYDHGVTPSDENLNGQDWNADGLVDANFFLRCRATKLLVSHQVPAGAFHAGEPAFAALSGLVEDAQAPDLVVAPNGSDVFLHNSTGDFSGDFTLGQPGLTSTPKCLAAGADPSLTFAIFDAAGNDRLTVIDHTLGDPSVADVAGASILVPLDDAVGLLTLLDGRLVAYDTVANRIVEMRPVVTRDLPLGAPTLTSVTAGFISAPFSDEVRDLAQKPSGALYALVASGEESQLVPLNPIDFDADGACEAADGTPVAGAAPILLPSSGPYDALEFLDETTALALQREADAVDRIDFSTLPATAERVVSKLARFNLPPGSTSPALAIAVAHMSLDVDVHLVENQPDGAQFELDPVSILPFEMDPALHPDPDPEPILPPGSPIDVMQRPNLASLSGVTEANHDVNAPKYVLGAKRLLSLFTDHPASSDDDCGVTDPDRVHDVLVEEFVDQSLEDAEPGSLSPLADWGGPIPGSSTSGRLSASVGAGGTAELGDFKPQPLPGFVVDDGYSLNPLAVNQAGWRFIFLDTDAQNFPLSDGSTPGVTSAVTVYGGKFGFHDVIIPEGVWVIAMGTNPLQITATGRVEIAGLIDVSGGDGLDDVTFDTGFLPVPGGPGGAGAGRGGNAQPTLWNPAFPSFIPVGTGQQAAQYVTPERAENGYGPVIGHTGKVTLKNKNNDGSNVGGEGGLSTCGYTSTTNSFTALSNAGNNSEYHRPPGGGGGTFYFHGMQAHIGSGAYRVQSDSQWPPYTLCNVNNFISDALYGNEELQLQGVAVPKLQCVYMQGSLANPERFQPGGLPGMALFPDGDPANDFIGPGGELPILIGGQGGGGGGTRIDSFNAATWSLDRIGTPFPPPNPPFYPPLFFNNIYWSPSLFDAKGGGGGGGGGSVLIRAFGDIHLTRLGHIDASGGDGLGGETVGNSNYAGGGGGGSGGAIVLQAGGEILIEADPDHVTPGFSDISLAQGASLDVSGGMGFDATEDPRDTAATPAPEDTVTRSDGGQGGFGMIQLQTGGPSGAPQIQQGAFLFARQRVEVKLGGWNGGKGSNQKEHLSWNAAGGPDPVLRYIDMLEYRNFKYENLDEGTIDGTPLTWLVLNGSDPPIITPDAEVPAKMYQLDSPMIDHYGRRLVREVQPHQIMKSYAGYDPVTFKEANWCLPCTPKKYLDTPPGTVYPPTAEIPLSIRMKGPDGTPLKEDPTATDPFAEFAHGSTIDRLPVVPLNKTPAPIGAVSRGTSTWLDFNGVALRARDAGTGLAPPLFAGINGTYNTLLGAIPPGKEAQVVLGAAVSNVPGSTQAHYVANTGIIPTFDKGLCQSQGSASPPFNDLKVDTPEYGIDNAITDNATVTLEFQGAFAIRAGSHVPDPDTMTGWVSDLRDLSGYPLVRFRVSFDLGVNPQYPFGPDSKKPGVDRLRVRAKY